MKWRQEKEDEEGNNMAEGKKNTTNGKLFHWNFYLLENLIKQTIDSLYFHLNAKTF